MTDGGPIAARAASTLLFSTSTTAQIVALQHDGTLHERVRHWRRGQPRTLLRDAIELLADASLPMSAVQRIVCDVGPGSFTGLRFGLATARTLAWALAVEAAAVGSLATFCAMAREHLGVDDGEGAIYAALPARRDVVYLRVEAGDTSIEQELPVADIAAWLVANGLPATPAVWVGPDATVAAVAAVAGPRGPQLTLEAPSAAALMRASWAAPVAAWNDLRPRYLALSQAERNVSETPPPAVKPGAGQNTAC